MRVIRFPFQNCTVATNAVASGGPKLINIKKLHDILRDELNIVQNTIASGQRQLILQEMESVLKFAIELNQQKNICASTVSFLEAWGQATEILFTVAPAFALCYENRGSLIIEILQALLNKVRKSAGNSRAQVNGHIFVQVVPVDVMTELARLASGTLLQMLLNLRLWYKHATPSEAAALSTSLGQANGSSASTALALSPKVNTLSLKYILKNIIDWIIISGESSQKLKINLYAALLNFMHIVKRTNQTEPLDDQSLAEK